MPSVIGLHNIHYSLIYFVIGEMQGSILLVKLMIQHLVCEQSLSQSQPPKDCPQTKNNLMRYIKFVTADSNLQLLPGLCSVLSQFTVSLCSFDWCIPFTFCPLIILCIYNLCLVRFLVWCHTDYVDITPIFFFNLIKTVSVYSSSLCDYSSTHALQNTRQNLKFEASPHLFITMDLPAVQLLCLEQKDRSIGRTHSRLQRTSMWNTLSGPLACHNSELNWKLPRSLCPSTRLTRCWRLLQHPSPREFYLTEPEDSLGSSKHFPSAVNKPRHDTGWFMDSFEEVIPVNLPSPVVPTSLLFPCGFSLALNLPFPFPALQCPFPPVVPPSRVLTSFPPFPH